MEVMFHDMERTLGKSVSLPCKDEAMQQSYTLQVIDPQAHLSTDEGDEAIDLHTGSGQSSPSHSLHDQDPSAADFAVGQQFLSSYPNANTSEQSLASATSTSSLDILEGPSGCGSSQTAACSPPPPTMAFNGLRLDDVAERWKEQQMGRLQSPRRKDVPRSREREVQTGLKAQC